MSSRVRWAQVVLGLLAVGLLAAHSDPTWLRQRGVPLTVDSTSVALVLLLALAIMLPQIRSFKAGGFGMELESNLKDAEKAAEKVQSLPGANTAGEPNQEAMRTATQEPLVSIESSRRSLAASLRELAERFNLSEPPSDLGDLATELMNHGPLTADEVEAVRAVAGSIRQAKQSVGSPAVALEIDYATQTLQGLIRQAAERRG